MQSEAVRGVCDSRFERVREEFERNFAERRELGASVCVIADGEIVVDLWGGVADGETGRPWEADTLNVIMSCSKGVTATCAHMLIDRGELDVDQTVAHYWPEFAQNGKAEITVRQAMSHQSGVAHVQRPIPRGELANFDLMVELTAEAAPYWAPGSRVGYHGLTIGWIVGELIRRVSGLTPGQFLRREITGPLGDLDCFMGLPEEHEHRVSRTVMFDIAAESGMPRWLWAQLNDPTSRTYKVITSLLKVRPLSQALAASALRRAEAEDPRQRMPESFIRGMLDPHSALFSFATNTGDYFHFVNSRAAHAGELPAGGAVASARGLAGVYAPLAQGGEHNGVRLVGPETIDGMRIAQAVTDLDVVIGGPSAYTLGFSKSWPSTREGSAVIIGEEAFGTPGMGGQIGFADPSYRLAFAYVMNRHGAGTGLNARGQSLVDAAYESVGSPGRTARYWRRPAA
jgi:CubicO group peptidase (beta-lactamase class C family)